MDNKISFVLITIFVMAINLGVFVFCVWIVLKMLQWFGVI